MQVGQMNLIDSIAQASVLTLILPNDNAVWLQLWTGPDDQALKEAFPQDSEHVGGNREYADNLHPAYSSIVHNQEAFLFGSSAALRWSNDDLTEILLEVIYLMLYTLTSSLCLKIQIVLRCESATPGVSRASNQPEARQTSVNKHTSFER